MSRVAEDSHCQRAGLRVGDKLVSVITLIDTTCDNCSYDDEADDGSMACSIVARGRPLRTSTKTW